jgi:hypothetical protein
MGILVTKLLLVVITYRPLIHLVHETIRISWAIEMGDWYLFTNHWEGFVNGLG